MHLPACGAGQLRIGVVLPVPRPFGAWLQALRARLGDPQGPLTPAHVTVLGPTVVDSGDLPAVHEHLAAVAARHAPFVLRLRGAGTFRPASPVVYAAVARGAEHCAALADAVGSGVLARPARYAYHPHVTVAQDVPDDVLDAAATELAGVDLTYPVRALSLHAHGDDGVWHARRQFPLTGDRAAARAGP